MSSGGIFRATFHLVPWWRGALHTENTHPLQHLLHKAVISICIPTVNNDINHLLIFVDCLNILYEEPVQILSPFFYWTTHDFIDL